MSKECPECKGSGEQGFTVCGTVKYPIIVPNDCPPCNGTGKQPEEKLNIFNLKDRQVDIDPDIAEIMPKIVDELLFGKQPEAPENIFMTYTGYDYGAWTTDKDLPGSDIEYIRKDKVAVCGNCDNIRATLQDKDFCHITGDFPSERICEKWELRK